MCNVHNHFLTYLFLAFGFSKLDPFFFSPSPHFRRIQRLVLVGFQTCIRPSRHLQDGSKESTKSYKETRKTHREIENVSRFFGSPVGGVLPPENVRLRNVDRFGSSLQPRTYAHERRLSGGGKNKKKRKGIL